MQRLEVSCAVRLIYKSLGTKGLNFKSVFITINLSKTKIYTSINFKYIGYLMIQLIAQRDYTLPLLDRPISEPYLGK